MPKIVLKIDDLTVESFALSNVSQDVVAGDVETGCVSDCVTGCGFGGSIC